MSSSEVQSKEFISIAFSHQNEKSQLLTLGGAPDWYIIVWQWDKGKCTAHQNLAISGNQECYQASFNILDPKCVLVTGNGVYKYYKFKETGLKPEHQSMAKKESHISNRFMCHTWMPDGKIIVATDQGELLLCESNGECKMMLSCSPKDGFCIESILVNTKGFMICGDYGTVMVFENRGASDPKNPFALLAKWPSEDTSAREDHTSQRNS